MNFAVENKGQIIIYQTPEGETELEVKLERDTLWLNQYQFADLFETDRTSILKHIRNIFEAGELSKNETCVKFAQVRKEGKRSDWGARPREICRAFQRVETKNRHQDISDLLSDGGPSRMHHEPHAGPSKVRHENVTPPARAGADLYAHTCHIFNPYVLYQAGSFYGAKDFC